MKFSLSPPSLSLSLSLCYEWLPLVYVVSFFYPTEQREKGRKPFVFNYLLIADVNANNSPCIFFVLLLLSLSLLLLGNYKVHIICTLHQYTLMYDMIDNWFPVQRLAFWHVAPQINVYCQWWQNFSQSSEIYILYKLILFLFIVS